MIFKYGFILISLWQEPPRRRYCIRTGSKDESFKGYLPRSIYMAHSYSLLDLN